MMKDCLKQIKMMFNHFEKMIHIVTIKWTSTIFIFKKSKSCPSMRKENQTYTFKQITEQVSQVDEGWVLVCQL